MSAKTRPQAERILVIEDDATLRLGLEKTLRSAGYSVTTAKTGDVGLNLALADKPDLILLDIMMPGMNGYEVCEHIREHDTDLPILMLTAKGDERDKVEGLKRGADDYIVKPFGIAELLARVDAALRRRRLVSEAHKTIVIGDVTIDFAAHVALKNNQSIEMTALEMKLLRFFVQNEGILLPRERILSAVWGADYFGTDRTVDNFINRLRTKFENDPKQPRYLMTVRGAGYRFSRTGQHE